MSFSIHPDNNVQPIQDHLPEMADCMGQEKLLTDLVPGEHAEIVRIDGGLNLKSRLQALGIFEGMRILKLSKVHFGGPEIIVLDRTQVAIGRGMAQKIFVRSCHNERKTETI